jgi:hypothetical protein
MCLGQGSSHHRTTVCGYSRVQKSGLEEEVLCKLALSQDDGDVAGWRWQESVPKT